MLNRIRIASVVALGVGLAFGTASAELVLDQPAAVQAESKTATGSATSSEITIRNEAVAAPQPAPAPAPAPVSETKVLVVPITAPMPAAAPAPAPATEIRASASEEELARDPTKADLKRRMRMREEIKNEDLLQERLETLRLRDEQKRADKILKDEDETQPGSVSGTAVQTQIINAPVTENPGQPVQADVIMTQQASAAPMGVSADEEKRPAPLTIGLSGQLGSSSMKNVQGYDISARYSAGLSLDIGMSENVSLIAGYQYSEYGLKFAPGNGFPEAARMNSAYYYLDPSLGRDTHTFKQNVFELGVRLYALGPDSKVRPYIGGGAGYARGYLNYDKRYLDLARRTGNANLARDYEISQILGVISAGLDVQVAKSISVGLGFKYFNVMSSEEDQPINNGALYYGGAYAPNYLDDPAKSYLGGSLARSSFYSILGNIAFSF